jgi:enamine deaminase RidA (YjgF/YER057c/UK114 family)
MLKTLINPHTLPRPKGYSHALRMWPCGRMLFLSGQVGWTAEGRFVSRDILGQFSQALANLKSAAEAGGGRMDDIVQMRIYTTDVPEYKRQAKQLGAVWREFFGGYYPAMTLVGVSRLWEDEAKVEIEAVAVLPPPPTNAKRAAGVAATATAAAASKPAASKTAPKHPRR